MMDEGAAQRRVPGERVHQRAEVVRVEAALAARLRAGTDRKTRVLTDGTDRAPSEEPERRRPPRHSLEVADERSLNLLPALAFGRSQPEVDGVVEGRRGQEKCLPHLGSRHDGLQAGS